MKPILPSRASAAVATTPTRSNQASGSKIALQKPGRRQHHHECDPRLISVFVIVSITCVIVPPLHLESHEYYMNEVPRLSHHHECMSFPILRIIGAYGISLLIAGSAFLTACCAGQFRCFALQSAVLDGSLSFL